jgi:hypothetical protein
VNESDEDTIINNPVSNLKKAATFINNITKGNYGIQWEGMEGKVLELNKESIAGELVMMREQMQKMKKEDDNGSGPMKDYLNFLT